MKRIIMGTVFLIAGIAHFLKPGKFAGITPGFIPFKTFTAYFTGLLEFAFGVLLLLGRIRNWQLNGMQKFLWAVFPANIYMYTHQEKLGLEKYPKWALLGRLPLQQLMVDMLEDVKK
ncbi:hypothetical protein WN59_12680 [Salinicoccus sediminis]|uniref:DoxX family protein n=1 Tax=Salinicoccus sediminis TaxID=1432562 RepID=A0A0M2SK00_9STAP|nr:DoxX family membrane protein [Salinicoccus sediminis]KKK32900.1 hypothetical protein WN59_12680 [Salinicoccus sediminis]